jgi:hypothetical protein
MKSLQLLVAALVLAGAAPLAARAEEAPSKEELRKSLKDIELAGNWIYDDIDAGFAAARESKKPLLVVFR